MVVVVVVVVVRGGTVKVDAVYAGPRICAIGREGHVLEEGAEHKRAIVGGGIRCGCSGSGSSGVGGIIGRERRSGALRCVIGDHCR